MTGWGSDTPKSELMTRIVCTIIAPTFYSAANYLILGKYVVLPSS
jgi:hypothetical protein